MKTKHTRLFASTAALIMFATVLAPMCVSEEDSSDAAETFWSYTLNLNNSSPCSISYSTGLSGKTPVSNYGANNGSWTFDDRGFGPFGSFYATFNSDGTLKGVLNPNDLTKYIDGTSAASDIRTNNTMWCLPTVYWKSESSTLTLSNDPSSGGTAYAHTIDGRVYKFIGIGVFEATNSGGVLKSISGTTPTVSQTRDVFRTQAAANVVDGGYAMQWNMYQWELYKMCIYASTGTFNSQASIGMGNVSGSGPSITGAFNTNGPFSGRSSIDQKGVKGFIENAWGSVFEFIDDVVVNGTSGFYIGQRSVVNNTTSDMSYVEATISDGWGGTVHTDARLWGFKSASGGSETTGLCDYLYTSSGDRSLFVGGYWGNSSTAGVGCAYASISLGDSYIFIGSRLAFVFDAGPASESTLTFNTAGGTAVPPQSVLSGSSATLPPAPTKIGQLFVGWYTTVDGETAFSFSTPIDEDRTIYARWVDILMFITIPSVMICITAQNDGAASFVALCANSSHVEWDMGDGTTYSDTMDITHCYDPGTYTVAVTAYNGNGAYTEYSTVTIPSSADEGIPIWVCVVAATLAILVITAVVRFL